ncbi:aspartate kinase [Gottschalkiaceae bacterium SANA]|nr:aspartate kinase [Gottschalkiaceae bacterium SANA]
MGTVMKFGGTSVASVEKMQAIARFVRAKREMGESIVVVVSAMGKTTDRLVEMAANISHTPDPRELDMLLSTGEQQSVALMAMGLDAEGVAAISMTGAQAGIRTEGKYTRNRIANIDPSTIEAQHALGKVVVVAGFQGMNEAGDITTLGRGGSDTTAVALAAKLGFDCAIYTDVEGVYSVDPRIVPSAKKLDSISYEEMMEMAALGAGVMEPRAVEIGKKYGVPIYVAKSLSEKTGTWIDEGEAMEKKLITGLSVSDEVLMVTVEKIPNDPGAVARIFQALQEQEINVDMISQTAPIEGTVAISFTCELGDREGVKRAIHQVKHDGFMVQARLQGEITKISVVGIGMRDTSGVASRMFQLFAREGIPFFQVTTSEISISYTIPSDRKQAAIQAIANEFEL